MATVKTQAELDAAIANPRIRDIYIESDAGVWLDVTTEPTSHVVAWGSSHVVAWGSSHVEAWESSHVVARGSSHVVAWGSSHVVARGSSHVEAWESSHVEARESSHVEAWESSHVEARESSHVEAWESSHVEARESSHVVAWGSSHVVARESSHVVAWGSSHVEAGTYTAVHLFSQRVVLDAKGAVVDMTSLDWSNPEVWCDLVGVKIDDGHVLLYKAVSNDLTSERGFAYPIGQTVTARDYRDDHKCGGGLHVSPTPAAAHTYYSDASRFLEIRVALTDLSPIDEGGAPKAKFRTGTIVREVTLWGEAL